MSHCRQQLFIDAPIEAVWDLLRDVDRHGEWWAGMVEVECEGLEPGCTYRQVNTNPFGRPEERMEPARIPHRVWDAVAGKRWYRDWLAKSLELMRTAAERGAAAAR